MLPGLVPFSLRLVHSLPLVCAVGGALCSSLRPVVAVELSHYRLGDARGTRGFYTCPNLQSDWLLVFVGVVMWWVSCVVVAVCSGLLTGSPLEDVTLGCLGLGARGPSEPHLS